MKTEETNIGMLQKFIYKNDLEFTNGRRNKDALTLCGYALFKECSLEEVQAALPENVIMDGRTLLETETVYNYGEANGYGNWWKDVKVVDHQIVLTK